MRYDVHVATSNVEGGGTDSRVYVDVRGAIASTGPRALAPRPVLLERNSTHKFSFRLPWLGDVHELVIGHDNSGSKAKYPRWHLNNVRLYDAKTNYWYTCYHGGWVDADSRGRYEVVLKVKNPKPAELTELQAKEPQVPDYLRGPGSPRRSGSPTATSLAASRSRATISPRASVESSGLFSERVSASQPPPPPPPLPPRRVCPLRRS